MNPDALDESHEKQRHDHECSPIADKWQRNPGNGHDEKIHPDILIDVGKNETYHPDDDEASHHVAAIKRHVDTLQQQQHESPEHEQAPPESVLLCQYGENEVVDGGVGRDEAFVIDRVWILEAFATPAATADRKKVVVGAVGLIQNVHLIPLEHVNLHGDSLFLVIFQPEEKGERQKHRYGQNDDDEVAKWNVADQNHRTVDRHPDDGGAEVALIEHE